jgi:hypothetical protein
MFFARIGCLNVVFFHNTAQASWLADFTARLFLSPVPIAAFAADLPVSADLLRICAGCGSASRPDIRMRAFSPPYFALPSDRKFGCGTRF